MLDLSRHPCFNDAIRHQFGRIHLPVAPNCNVQCNFCDRRFSCVNESRPGVTTTVLSPEQALYYLERALGVDPRISVVGIAGPGDPFANAVETLRTLRLVRERFPDMLLCVASNGLNVPPHVDELAELAVSHVTLTINAVDPQVGARIYAWIRDGKRPFRGETGAAILLERQMVAIRQLKARDIVVKVNSILIPGVNHDHIDQIARVADSMGVDILNCIPLYPVEGTPFAEIEPPNADMVSRVRAEASQHLPMMHHCTRCRADAAGLLMDSLGETQINLLQEAAGQPDRPGEERPCVAVASMEGVLVNLHLGEAASLSIYRQENDGFEMVEQRETPPPGSGSARWEQLAQLLSDCRAVLVSSAGQSPVQVLQRHGVTVVMMEGLIEEGLECVYGGREVRAPLRRKHNCGAGAGCGGDGTGCG